jgi:hypothetical protein
MTNENDKEYRDLGFLSDILVRITAIEKLLITKGIVTGEEIAIEIHNISRILAKSLIKGAKVQGDADQILDELIKDKSDN